MKMKSRKPIDRERLAKAVHDTLDDKIDDVDVDAIAVRYDLAEMYPIKFVGWRGYFKSVMGFFGAFVIVCVVGVVLRSFFEAFSIGWNVIESVQAWIDL